MSAKPIQRSQEYTNEELIEYVNNVQNKFDFIKILSVKRQNVFIQLNKLCKENNIKIAGHFPSNISDEIIFDSTYYGDSIIVNLESKFERRYYADETRLHNLAVSNHEKCYKRIQKHLIANGLKLRMASSGYTSYEIAV